MSTSVPTFRFQVGEDEIEQIYPEIEEETVEKENPSPSKNGTCFLTCLQFIQIIIVYPLLYVTVDDLFSVLDTLSDTPPTAPPRSPRHGRPHHKASSGVASGDVSPVHTSLSTGSLNKRSSSMDTGIVETPGLQ